MAKSSMDALLDRVEWREVTCARVLDDTPYVTHEGVLTLVGDARLRCYQLSDGRRILDANDVEELLRELTDD
jgi:hypothetical protein